MLTVRIVNDTSHTLYLGDEEMGCASSLGWRFELERDGQGLSAPGNCGSCTDWTTDGTMGCPTICLTMPALALQAGEHVDLPWTGLVSSRVALPAACVVNDGGVPAPSQCAHAIRAPAGQYTLSAQAGTALKCDESAGGCSACQPREAGGCESRELVEKLELEATLDVTLGSGPNFDVTDPLELVFRD